MCHFQLRFVIYFQQAATCPTLSLAICSFFFIIDIIGGLPGYIQYAMSIPYLTQYKLELALCYFLIDASFISRLQIEAAVS